MGDFFYGWYLKCQSDTGTLAVIPSVHKEGDKQNCSLQLITEENAWTVNYRAERFLLTKRNIYVGENRFGKDGIRLSLKMPGLSVNGELSLGKIWPLKYPIMGPFHMVPFMECRHQVYSMLHSVNGKLRVNERDYVFRNGIGYWEGDSGCSFPRNYVWTQCFFPGGALMLSVADIPIGKVHFTGVIGIVLWHGKEYRFATYLGAKVLYIRNQAIAVIQGNMKLEARLLYGNGQSLKAPVFGGMNRTIQESVVSHALYRFRKGKETLFTFTTKQASFEYEYPL